ncbi:NUDIX domain-containing protein [Clavibacter sp. CT19]|uniref:NUDIX domain-containing protein n=1 Tax=Clavibacter sp. CT19 TaxID=3018990 RepID=UPI002FDC69B1
MTPDPAGALVAGVRDAYAARADEYAAHLGSLDAVHPSDRALVASWADGIEGPVLDAGCGPGHWTAFLAARGLDARGVDLVPAFVAHARAAHPGIPFAVGDLDALAAADGELGGALAWYSLIHHYPARIGLPLRELARVIRPGGALLVGAFSGTATEPFDHAVTPAWRWAPDELAAEVEAAGFEVVEVHTRTGPGHRPHLALTARASPPRPASTPRAWARGTSSSAADPDPTPAAAEDPEPGWTTTDRRDLHRGRVVLVDHGVLLPDGSASRYEVDESVPFAVATLVIDGDAVLLSRQYRYPLGRWILDLPGGAGNAGEEPADAARRELEEELGLVAPEVRPLRTHAVNPGRASWLVHVFACTTPTTAGTADRSDPSEQVRLVRMPVAELDALIAAGDVVDPTLLIARAAAAEQGLLPPVAPR